MFYSQNYFHVYDMAVFEKKTNRLLSGFLNQFQTDREMRDFEEMLEQQSTFFSQLSKKNSCNYDQNQDSKKSETWMQRNSCSYTRNLLLIKNRWMFRQHKSCDRQQSIQKKCKQPAKWKHRCWSTRWTLTGDIFIAFSCLFILLSFIFNNYHLT